MKKNLVSILMAICLVANTIPMSVIADEESLPTQDIASTSSDIIGNDEADSNITDDTIINDHGINTTVTNSDVTQPNNSPTTSTPPAYNKEKATTFEEVSTAVAFIEAVGNGLNVKIKENLIIEEFATVNGNVIIDLNGNKITREVVSGIDTAILVVSNTSSLTILDSGSGGKLENTANGGIGITNGGNLTILSGTIEATGLTVYNQGEMIISGGSIYATDSEGIAVYNNLGNLTISNGTIYTTASKGTALYNLSGNVVISEGEIYSKGNESIAIINTVDDYATPGTLKISGGKVWSNGNNCYTILHAMNNIEISGGEIYTQGSESVTIFSYYGDITLTGGQVYSSAIDGIAIKIKQQGKINISGTAKVISNYAYNDSGTIDIEKINNNIKIAVSDQAIVSNIAKNGARYAIYFYATDVTSDNYTNYYSSTGGTVGAIYPAKKHATFSGLQSIGTVFYNGTTQAGYTGSIVTDYTGEIELTYYLADGITKTTTENSGADTLGGAPKNIGSYMLVYGVAENAINYTGINSITFTIKNRSSSGDTSDSDSSSSNISSATLAPSQPAPWQIILEQNQITEITVNSSSPELTVRCSLPFNLFKAIRINGIMLNTSYYTAKEGSTIVTINPAYLATLPLGKHKIEFVGTDGSVTTTYFHLQPNPSLAVNPSTGAKI